MSKSSVEECVVPDCKQDTFNDDAAYCEYHLIDLEKRIEEAQWEDEGGVVHIVECEDGDHIMTLEEAEAFVKKL